MFVVIFYWDSSKQFDLMLVLNLFRTFSSINTDKSIFCLPNCVIVSYNTERKNILTKTIWIAITTFLRAFNRTDK